MDASVPAPVAKALALVRRDIAYPGQPDCPVANLDTPDHEWLRIAGDLGWTVVMRDKRIRTRPGERARLREHCVRAFCLTTAGNASTWDTLTLLVKNWPEMERRVLAEEGPFIYALTGVGARRLFLPDAPPRSGATRESQD